MRRSTAALAFLAAASLPSCGLFCDEADLSCGGSPVRSDPSCASITGKSCNAADYTKGLFLEMPALPDGTYSLEGSADGQPFTCTVTATSGESFVGCPDLPQSPFGSGKAIEFGAVPCSVTVELRQGETVLIEQTIRPDYHWDEPWGEGCDWRGLAEVQLELPAGD